MNELPQPTTVPQSPGVSPPTRVQSPQVSTQNTPAPAPTDDKIMQERAIEQIESIVLQTMTNPYERANQVHAVKDAFLKARYGMANKDGIQ